jgi:membrane-associated protein
MDWFHTFAEQFAVYGYPVLFIGVLLENAGIPVPGETAVLVAGFLSSPAGGSHFNVLWVILVTFVAAVVGDNVGFWLGHAWARQRLRQGRWFLFLTPKSLELAESYFNRYGIWTIFFARFITGLRVIGALAAGTAGMPWLRFLFANAAGALAWSVTMSLLGYFFGHSWELLHKWLGRGALIILGSVIVLAGLPFLLRRLRKLVSPGAPGSARRYHLDRLAHAQIWQGLLVASLEVVCIGILVLQAEAEHATRMDQIIRQWIEQHDSPVLDVLALWGSYLGALPVIASVTVGFLGLLSYQGRPWREYVAVLWALLASQSAGWLLMALFHGRDIEYIHSNIWPFEFAGLLPLRALAVLGMVAKVTKRQNPTYGRWAEVLATIVVLWAGFGIVWTNQQYFSATAVEFAAGGLILFTGLWWLEGHGPGLRPIPPSKLDGAMAE